MTQNFLSTLEFDLTIHRLPQVSFQVQTVVFPGISMGETPHATPNFMLPLHGDRITYEPLSITLKLDEQMTAWDELHNWMIGLTKPQDTEQYLNLTEGEGLYSDATITMISNNRVPIRQFTFLNMFPQSLGAISMDTKNSDIEFVTLDVTFRYESFATANLS